MFVVNFNEKVTLGLPDAISFTNRSEDLERAISRAPTVGMTALYDAVVKALERVQAGGRDKRALLVISDGGDNASRNSLVQLLKMAEQSSALIYAIGIFDEDDPDRNTGVLEEILLDRPAGRKALLDEELGKSRRDEQDRIAAAGDDIVVAHRHHRIGNDVQGIFHDAG